MPTNELARPPPWPANADNQHRIGQAYQLSNHKEERYDKFRQSEILHPNGSH